MGYQLKFFLCLFLLISSSSNCLADKTWRFFAGLEDEFIHETTTAISVGLLGPKSEVGTVKTSYGLELSFNSPLLQPPSNRIRQQLSYLQYEDGNSVLQTLQINPHYVVEISKTFWFGAGPGISLVRADVDNRKANILAGQLGTSLHYSVDNFFIGAEARYQITQQDDVGKGMDNGANNWQAVLKLGYNHF